MQDNEVRINLFISSNLIQSHSSLFFSQKKAADARTCEGEFHNYLIISAT